jgi:exodeoxyribonuclease-3
VSTAVQHRIVSWNVNGLRARADAVVDIWSTLEPTVLCLQETKCVAEQVPPQVTDLPGTIRHWNGGPKGYSGTAILLREAAFETPPELASPPFDDEARAVELTLGSRTLLNLYMPNGGKNYPAKLAFYDALIDYTKDALAAGREVWLCGDMNIAHTDLDIHERHRPKADIGVRPAERQRIDALLELGLSDIYRDANPDRDDLFTWWPYWRNLRAKNRGWRIDYHLVSAGFGSVSETSVYMPETGSDHAPLVADVSF